jgi:hypothetical protein
MVADNMMTRRRFEKLSILCHVTPIILLSCFFLSISFICLDNTVISVYGTEKQSSQHLIMLQYQIHARTPLHHVSSNDTNATDSTVNANTTTPSSLPLPGIQIAYPNEWLVNDLGNGTVRFSSPLRTDLMRFTVNVANLPSSMKSMTLDNIVELNLNASRQQLSNFSLIEADPITISSENQSAYKIVYSNSNKDPNFPLSFKTMQVFAIKDGQLYTLSYVSEASQYGRYLPTIENMIDSVTFAKDRGLETTGSNDLMPAPKLIRI